MDVVVSRRKPDGWKPKRAGVDGVDAYGRLVSLSSKGRRVVGRSSVERLSPPRGGRAACVGHRGRAPSLLPPPFLETRNEIQSLTTTDLHTFPGWKAAAAATPATVNA